MKKIITGADAEKKYYSDYYLEDHKRYFSSELTKNEIESLVRWTEKLPDSVCDIACGNGRHLAAFAKMGVNKGYGFDLSDKLAQAAAAELQQHNGFTVENKNFFDWEPASQQYDLVYMLFSSLGHCLSLEKAENLIAKMVKATKPGGSVCIDADNIFRLIRFLEGKSKKIMETEEEVEFDASKMLLKAKDIRNKEVLVTDTRYYLATELSTMFERAGIMPENIQFKGGFSGEFYSYKSDRLIVLVKK